MPHINPYCPKCEGSTNQTKFIEADPNRSGTAILRGEAFFKCRECGYTFISNKGRKILCLQRKKDNNKKN